MRYKVVQKGTSELVPMIFLSELVMSAVHASGLKLFDTWNKIETQNMFVMIEIKL